MFSQIFLFMEFCRKITNCTEPDCCKLQKVGNPFSHQLLPSSIHLESAPKPRLEKLAFRLLKLLLSKEGLGDAPRCFRLAPRIVLPDCAAAKDLLEEVRTIPSDLLEELLVIPPEAFRVRLRPVMARREVEPLRFKPILGRTAVATAAVCDTNRPLLSLRFKPSPAMVPSNLVFLPSLPYLSWNSLQLSPPS